MELRNALAYYKGEKKCPYNNSDKAAFWEAEKTFVETMTPEYERVLVAQANAFTKAFKNGNLNELQRKFMTYGPEKKVLAVFVQEILQKFCPGDCDAMLLNY